MTHSDLSRQNIRAMNGNCRISRRRFLRRTATLGSALAAPTIVGSSIFADVGKSPPGERITIGMIGVGRQVMEYNLDPFLSAHDTQVVAVCDVDAWRLENARQRVEKYYADRSRSGVYRGCTTYQDYRELLGRDDIDAVMISTPDNWHVPMSIAAAEAGKDVCCEKPLTRSIAEGRQLCDVITQHGRVFRTDSEARFKPSFHRAVELARSGAVGQIHTIRVGVPKDDKTCGQPANMPVPEELNYDLWLGPAPVAPYTEKRVHPKHSYERGGWMRVQDYCDGMICNWGAHLVDIAQWGNNTDRTGPVEVSGTGEYPEGELWNALRNFEVDYKYSSGVRMVFKDVAGHYTRFEGTDGWVEAGFSDESLKASDESILKTPSGKNTPSGRIRLPRKDEKRDFIDSVKTRGQTIADAEVGHRTNSVCLLGQIAVRIGTQLRWDPAAEQFINSPAANQLLSRQMREPWTL